MSFIDTQQQRNYWVVRKVHADFEGKLKHRRFKFLTSFIKFKSFAAQKCGTKLSGQPNIYIYISIIPPK